VDQALGYISEPDQDDKIQVYPALPGQEKFHASKAKKVCLAGGLGSGKTSALVLQGIMEMSAFKDNRVLLIRRYLTALKSSTLLEFKRLCPPSMIKSWNQSEQVITFWNGSRLDAIGLDGDIDRVKSVNAGCILVEEASSITEEVYLMLCGRLRRQNSSRRMFLVSNSEGHDAVVWKHFVGPERDKDSELIVQKTEENFHLPADYVASLRANSTKEWSAKFLDCSFSVNTGLVYSEYLEDRNSEPGYTPSRRDELVFVMDWGFRHPCAVGLFATDYDGVSHLYRAWYQAGQLAETVAAWIKSQEGFKDATCLCDPSIKGVIRDKGNTLFDEFSDLGVDFQLASNDRPQGFQKVNQLLRHGYLKISKEVPDWFIEHGEYRWKDVRPGDYGSEDAVKVKDDLMDVTRYFANHREVPSLPKPDNTPGWVRQLEREDQEQKRRAALLAHKTTRYSDRFV
jgi:PBSX family phage terminase large subunit